MSCSPTLTLWAGNTFVLEVQGLKHSTSQAWANAATVTARIQTFKGVDVAGVTWPLTLAYVAASNGIYRGTLPAAAELVVGKTYKYEITATENGAVALWQGNLSVDERPLISP